MKRLVGSGNNGSDGRLVDAVFDTRTNIKDLTAKKQQDDLKKFDDLLNKKDDDDDGTGGVFQ